MSVCNPFTHRAGPAMFPTYDHRQMRICWADVVASWVIAAVLFVIAAVL